MAAEKYFRQLRLPELTRRSYPKKNVTRGGISGELADAGNRRIKALKPENANYQFLVKSSRLLMSDHGAGADLTASRRHFRK
jgi:hypothetical protein